MKNIKYKKILYTTDGSAFATHALPYAVSLAKTLKAELTMMHIVESVGQVLAKIDPLASLPVHEMVYKSVIDSIVTKDIATYNHLAKEANKLEDEEHMSVRVEVAEGETGEEIINAVKNEKFDLVVMSTHGRSGLSRAVLGSVADYVVHKAKCPVMLVKPI